MTGSWYFDRCKSPGGCRLANANSSLPGLLLRPCWVRNEAVVGPDGYDRTRRLSVGIEWADLEFVERERTREQTIEVGIQLHFLNLSLSNNKQYLERFDVGWSRTAINNRAQKADLQSAGNEAPNQIQVDETMIRINDERHWLYTDVVPETNEFHIRLF